MSYAKIHVISSMARTIDDIHCALARIEGGESVAAVARSSQLKRTTMYKYMNIKAMNGSITIGTQGRFPLIPNNLEVDLVAWIAAMQRAGWPVERYEVIMKANSSLTDHFGVPRSIGRGWYARFEKRHQELKCRAAQKLSHDRNAVTREGITKYFFVKGVLGFPCTAGDIYIFDETSVKTKGNCRRCSYVWKLPSRTMSRKAWVTMRG
ncbi:Aste57867_14437 [Aphanomyces stellatus]|uniref:Aste57867_14437 protein n=1 Tax=Aphanomyces stellatus TaxID=120398 RepID=A0A485L181_9STRA|nr:hypothetical protein As57867_014383 [Aphanomyces stellatus]VFT91259.1 Aste57867_14437 [Aphanomyces stellatus]